MARPSAKSDTRRSPKGTLKPVSRTRLYVQIADSLREMIDIEEMGVGDRLPSEREISERLGVSRHSVRQAFTALEVGGLIEIRHGDGVYIRQAPEVVQSSLASELERGHADIPSILELRGAIEAQTTRLAASRRSAEDLLAMRQTLEQMSTAIEVGDDPSVPDAAFHDAIVRAAGNALIQKVWDELSESVDLTRRASLARPHRPESSLADHRAVFEAIERGDGERASDLMRAHLHNAADLGFLSIPEE